MVWTLEIVAFCPGGIGEVVCWLNVRLVSLVLLFVNKVPLSFFSLYSSSQSLFLYYLLPPVIID
jgi:hypothetical protein